MINQLLGEFSFKRTPKAQVNLKSRMSINASETDIIEYVVNCMVSNQAIEFKETNSPELFEELVKNLDHQKIENAILKMYVKAVAEKRGTPQMLLSRVTSNVNNQISFLVQEKESLHLENYKISKYYDILIDRITSYRTLNQIKGLKVSFRDSGTSRARNY